MPNHTESHAWMPVRPVTTGNFVMLSQRDYETLMDTMNRYRAALRWATTETFTYRTIDGADYVPLDEWMRRIERLQAALEGDGDE